MKPGSVHLVNDVWLYRGRGRAVHQHLPKVEDYVGHVSRMGVRALMAECNKRGIDRPSEEREDLLAVLLEGIAPIPDPLPQVRGAHTPAPEPEPVDEDDAEADDDAGDEPDESSQNETPQPRRKRGRK